MREFIWMTEMTDPSSNWNKVIEKVDQNEPIVVTTKSLSIPEKVINYSKVAFQITISGWGGTWLEPCVSKADRNLYRLNKLVRKVGKERVIVRIDPLILTKRGIHKFITVVQGIEENNIKIISSPIQLYNKQEWVFKRLNIDLNRYNIKSGVAYFPDKEYLEQCLNYIYRVEPSVIGRLSICGVPYQIAGVLHKGCVSEDVLKSIGITKFRKVINKQREGCKCIIKKKQVIRGSCRFGCLYCYAHKENLTKIPK